MSNKLQPSTRVTAGVFMLLAGVMLAVLAVTFFLALKMSFVLPLLAASILAVVGVFQMVRGLRERGTRP